MGVLALLGMRGCGCPGVVRDVRMWGVLALLGM